MSSRLICRPPRGAAVRCARCLLTMMAGVTLALVSRRAEAQTDYYNTDARRPLRTEDAYAIEHRALEIQAAPLRITRIRGGYAWEIEPELAWGWLPRTQLEVGVPISVRARTAAASGGLTSRRDVTASVEGAELSILHNLNVETRVPALAIRADAHVLAEPFTDEVRYDRTYTTLTAIATKTFRWARFHANLGGTLGRAPSLVTPPLTELPAADHPLAVAGETDHSTLSRWSAGVAVDRTLPLRSLLFGAELYAERPLAIDVVQWNAALGSRWQLSPRWAVDGGVGRRINGADPTWFVTFGGAAAIGTGFRAAETR